MSLAPLADNCLTIAGRVIGPCETRTSPAGIAISRFLLEHHSSQMEADGAREVYCRISVLACGEPIAATARKLSPETPVRVSGFIARANNREGAYRLVLHAARIDLFDLE